MKRMRTMSIMLLCLRISLNFAAFFFFFSMNKMYVGGKHGNADML